MVSLLEITDDSSMNIVEESSSSNDQDSWTSVALFLWPWGEMWPWRAGRSEKKLNRITRISCKGRRDVFSVRFEVLQTCLQKMSREEGGQKNQCVADLLQA